MLRVLSLTILLSICVLGYSQKVFVSNSGEISFFSETPVENIDATNKSVKGIINAENKEIAIVTDIIGFHFDKPLMEEHFNENYLESDKYKTAYYKGKIEGEVDYNKDGKYPVKSSGVLSIHGVEQKREIQGEIIVSGQNITLLSDFDVNLSDHKIKVPKLVTKKLAETIKVKVNMSFNPKK